MSKSNIELYFKIKKQRENIIAPVDTMGCHAVPENLDEDTRRWQLLVKLLLSAQTKDEITHATLEKLNKELIVGNKDNTKDINQLTIKNIRECKIEHLNDLIKKVGFHNRKAKYIKAIADIGRLPSDYDGIMKLPGVGPKMTLLYFQFAYNKVLGISVDLHVHRISNRLKIINTKSELQSRKELEKVIPKEEWGFYNKVMVGFGQVICKSNPECSKCIIKDECPSSKYKF
ncbi:Endonuclease III [Spraguea lophii 42_110]|uniref:Endonuclease III n=1 Tax=Spraguea lophii (strain 42_110) TaxID=1358809 RepID=S7W9G4_SPRLO|nr:Endonuclease III [Spraguea lophii 42_110]